MNFLQISNRWSYSTITITSPTENFTALNLLSQRWQLYTLFHICWSFQSCFHTLNGASITHLFRLVVCGSSIKSCHARYTIGAWFDASKWFQNIIWYLQCWFFSQVPNLIFNKKTVCFIFPVKRSRPAGLLCDFQATALVPLAPSMVMPRVSARCRGVFHHFSWYISHVVGISPFFRYTSRFVFSYFFCGTS